MPEYEKVEGKWSGKGRKEYFHFATEICNRKWVIVYVSLSPFFFSHPSPNSKNGGLSDEKKIFLAISGLSLCSLLFSEFSLSLSLHNGSTFGGVNLSFCNFQFLSFAMKKTKKVMPKHSKSPQCQLGSELNASATVQLCTTVSSLVRFFPKIHTHQGERAT